MTDNFDGLTDAAEGSYDLEAVEEAQAQLKVMWSLYRRLHVMARAAAAGAVTGVLAAIFIGGYVAWQISRTGDVEQILAEPDPVLLVEFALLAAILAMSGYLWFRRSVARASAAALEDEIVTVRAALQREFDARRGTSLRGPRA